MKKSCILLLTANVTVLFIDYRLTNLPYSVCSKILQLIISTASSGILIMQFFNGIYNHNPLNFSGACDKFKLTRFHDRKIPILLVLADIFNLEMQPELLLLRHQKFFMLK